MQRSLLRSSFTACAVFLVSCSNPTRDNRAKVTLPGDPLPGLAGALGYSGYYGDVHGHTSYSSDWCNLHRLPEDHPCHEKLNFSPADYFHEAINNDLHFVVITDHAEDLSEREWERTKIMAADAQSRGGLIPFLGYEVVGDHSRHMDVNVLFPTLQGAPVYADSSVPRKTPDQERPPHYFVNRERLWQKLERTGAIGFLAHPPDTSVFAFGSYERAALKGLEVYSGGGRTHDERYCGVAAESALRRGLHYAFVGAGNNHTDGPGLDGLTVALAKDLTREAVWDALIHRRTYTVTNSIEELNNQRERVRMSFDVNGHLMGDPFDVKPEGSGLANLTLNLTVARDKTPIYHVAISRVKDGKRSTLGEAYTDHLTLTDSLAEGESAAYYAVAQLQGTSHAAAWSSPVYVTARRESSALARSQKEASLRSPAAGRRWPC